MKEIISLIKSDLDRLGDANIKAFFRWYIRPRGSVFPYIVWLRIVMKLKEGGVMFFTALAYLVLRHYEFKYGVHTDTNIKIGEGLHIVHGDGVYLNCSEIGDNFTVYQGVTIGVDKNGGKPQIKNGVTIYPNSVVCGNIVLNDNCTIGALSYVSHDVCDGDLVIGAPAHSIHKYK